jgi:hypothetical protein
VHSLLVHCSQSLPISATKTLTLYPFHSFHFQAAAEKAAPLSAAEMSALKSEMTRQRAAATEQASAMRAERIGAVSGAAAFIRTSFTILYTCLFLFV